MTRFVFDVETNGIGTFRPPTQKVMQLAYGAWNPGETLQPKRVYIRGAAEVAPKAFELHGIHPSVCEEKGVDIRDAVREMLAEMRGCTVLTGHNVEFDIGCILNHLQEVGANELYDEMFDAVMNTTTVCTMRLGTDICKLPKTGAAARFPGFKFPTLGELHTHLFGSLPEINLHDAGADCKVTAKCFDAIFPEAIH